MCVPQQLHKNNIMYTDNQETSIYQTDAAFRCQSVITIDMNPSESAESELPTLSPNCVMSEKHDFDRSKSCTEYRNIQLPDLNQEDGQEHQLPKTKQILHARSNRENVTPTDANVAFDPSAGKKRVRFVPSLVTQVHTRPRTETSDWQYLYYTGHELQKMIDQRNGRNCKPLCFKPRRCIIVAEEEDLGL